MKSVLEAKQKTFSLVSIVLSFKLKKQNTKNISDITFNFKFNFCLIDIPDR